MSKNCEVTNEDLLLDEVCSSLFNLDSLSDHHDLVLQVEEQDFFVHRCILSSASDYFYSLINFHDELHTRKVTLGKVPVFFSLTTFGSTTLRVLLTFIYTGELDLSSTSDNDLMMDLIVTADYIQLNDLLLLCYQRISNYFWNSGRIPQYYQLALKLELSDLQLMCMTCIARDFSKYIEDNALLELDLKAIEEILKDERLVLRDSKTSFCFGKDFETRILDFVDKWVSYDETSREIYLGKLKDICLNTLSRHDEANSLQRKFYAQPLEEVFVLTEDPYGQHPPFLRGPPFNFRIINQETQKTWGNCSPNLWVLKNLVVYVAANWNEEVAIGGVDVSYRSIWDPLITINNECGLNSSPGYYEVAVDLDDDERIIEVSICHSWLLRSLKFSTNRNRVFGPYGNNTLSGRISTIKFLENSPHPLYFHGFTYSEIVSRGLLLWNQVGLVGAVIDHSRIYADFGLHMSQFLGLTSQEDLDGSSQGSINDDSIIDVERIAFSPLRFDDVLLDDFREI